MKKPKAMTIKEIAEAVIKELKEEDLEALKAYDEDNIIDLHYGLGMYIRNKYVWQNQGDFIPIHPDDVSQEVLKEMLRMLKAQKKK